MIRQRRFANVFVLGICAVCVMSVAARFPRWIRGPDEAYVIVAEDAWASRLGLHNYDDAVMATRTAAMTDGRNRNFLAPTPPSIAVLLLPLAWLPTSARPIVWLSLNVAAVLTTCWLLGRTLSWPARHPVLAIAAVAAVLFSEPLAENLSRGQVYLLLMPAAAGVLVATATGRPAGAIGLALCTVAKLWGGAVWIALIAARMWRALALAGTLTALLLVGGVYAAGLETWSYYFRVVLPQWLSTPKMMVTAYQTIPSALAHFFRADAQWNPHPLANVPTLGLVLTLIVGGSLLAMTLWRAASAEHRLAGIAASVILAVIFSPVAEQYHYLLIVPSIAIAVEVHGLRGRIQMAVLLLALLLLFLPIPFKSSELAQMAGGVFAYPRVSAALLFWGLLVISPPAVAGSRTSLNTPVDRAGG